MGLDLLIAAAGIVRHRRPDLLLLIGGTGPWRRKLGAQIAEMGLEKNVHLLGFVPDSELPLYYQAADLFVLPTLASEGFGLITLEALACDLPVLGTRVGHTEELLSGFDPEMLFDDTTPEAFAARIEEWLARLTLGPSASYREQVVEQFNWDRCVDGFLEAALGSVLRAPRGKAPASRHA
jgi:glycosyltransferase involved in cell wall biosynthesis